MANWQVGNSSNHNVLNWERRLDREILKMMKFTAFVGRGPTAGIRMVDELSRGNAAGDTVYTTLLMNLTGEGVAGDDQLVGNEESLTLHRQTVTINQLRNAVKSDGRITNQRSFINFQEEAREVLQKWGSDVMDKWQANQLSGNTGESNTNLTGMQSPSAPSSATGNMRIIYGPNAGGATTEASLSVTSTSAFQLTMLDQAVATAATATPAIEPINTGNGPRYVAILHPYQIYYLKTDATAGRVTWYDYQKSRIEGSRSVRDIIGNPERGALGQYNNVIIHEDSRIPLAPSTSRVRRAVFFGAQAGVLAFGREQGPYSVNRWRYDEEEEDYKNRLGIAVATIGGAKKNVYNSIDFGTIVLSSYAAAP